MWTLRLALIALGILFIAGLYFYTRRHPPGRRGDRARLRDPAGTAFRAREQQIEPQWTLPETDSIHPEPSAVLPEVPSRARVETSETAILSDNPVVERKIFALAVRFPGEGTPAVYVAQALTRLGCTPRPDGIYRCAGNADEALYEVANLFEPGVLEPLPPDTLLRGLVFFFQAEPGREAATRFERMLGAVRECADRFEGRVEDHAHRPLTAARELEIRLAVAGERNPS